MKTDLETIIPLLIGAYRKIAKEEGPLEHLQTREFRTLISQFQKEKKVKNYLEEKEHLLPSLLYDFIIHYQEGLSLIGEVPLPLHRVLDVGAGLGPYSLAALKHGARDVVAIDQSERALELGSTIIGKLGYPMTVRKWTYPKEIPVTGNFDLIILGHSALEMCPEDRSLDILMDTLLRRLTPQGFLLIVESSWGEFNRRVCELRDRLVEKGIAVQAPCIFKGMCPALKTPNSPCYAQREMEKPPLIKEIQRALSINLSSLKMTYILFRAPNFGWPKPPIEPVYRVISPPVESFHSKMYYLCGTDGKRTLSSRLKEHPKQSRAFEYLKRGELLAIINGVENKMAYDIVEGTEIKIIAPLGKPMPVND